MLYSLDASIGEICAYIEVSDQTIYNWEKKNPELFGKLKRMRDKPVLKARQTAIQKIGESYFNAMDFLKRKRKLEFGDGVDITSGGEKIIPIYGGSTIGTLPKNDGERQDTSIEKTD